MMCAFQLADWRFIQDVRADIIVGVLVLVILGSVLNWWMDRRDNKERARENSSNPPR